MKLKFKLGQASIYTVILVCLLIIFDLGNYKKFDRVIEYDVHTYYSYLPALFIFNDIKIEKSDYLFDENYHLFWLTWNEDGRRAMKMTMGTAIFYTPFFFVAHGFALLTDYPENGFSEPYKLLLIISSVFFLFVGLEFIRKILYELGFTDVITAIIVVLIGLGTNLLAYSSQSAPLSHVYSFCLFAVFVYFTISWHEKPSLKDAIWLGVIFGLISLVRPVNSIILVFFILYGINNWKGLRSRIKLIANKKIHIILIIVLTIIIWIPQFFYWEKVTGSFLYYSYTDEGFFFNKPKIFAGLFSFRKGWLIYTPIMVFSLVGIFLMNSHLKKARLGVIMIFLINIYITFSWWCWWYGGTFGQRSLIESYAILAIPFASFIQFVNSKNLYIKLLFYALTGFFIWLNIYQTYQFENQSLHWDGMSRELYFKQFGKMERIDDFDKYVHWPNYEKEKVGSMTFSGFINKIFPDAIYRAKESEKGQEICILSFRNQFVSYDINKNSIVVDRQYCGEWEKFDLIKVGKNTYAFRTFNGLFLSLYVKENYRVHVANSIGQNEIFELVESTEGNTVIKANNGKYLTYDENSFELYAKADSTGVKSKFKMSKAN